MCMGYSLNGYSLILTLDWEDPDVIAQQLPTKDCNLYEGSFYIVFMTLYSFFIFITPR